MKISLKAIFGAVVLTGTQLLLPVGAWAEVQFDRPAGSLHSTPSPNRSSASHVDEFKPPDTGGPSRSGGAGTR